MNNPILRTADNETDRRPITDEEIAWAIDHEACYEDGAADAPAGNPAPKAKPRSAVGFAVSAAMVVVAVAAAVALVA
ncbi:MAG TPA: hypothetical protein VLA00_10480 [Xanthobacteraceae bacterium]|nr:hypothetical protein [Xanthobacteraceae bacterium]